MLAFFQDFLMWEPGFWCCLSFFAILYYGEALLRRSDAKSPRSS